MCTWFFLSFVYICITVGDPMRGGLEIQWGEGWRSNEGRVGDPMRGGMEIQWGEGWTSNEGRVGDPMRGGLEIQWGKGWSPVTLFNLFTLLCLSIPLIGFTPSHIYVCRDIKRHMSWSFFVLSDVRWEVVVRFVGRTVDYWCLHFLFIICTTKWMNIHQV
jgi:hypothetical protein